jgi:hypothetical protein
VKRRDKEKRKNFEKAEWGKEEKENLEVKKNERKKNKEMVRKIERRETSDEKEKNITYFFGERVSGTHNL